jgi:anti-sigma B factor antagonist
MKIEVSNIGDIAVVQIDGRLVSGVGDIALRDAINQLLADDRRKIVIDLSRVSHLDSSGVGELVASRKICRRFGSALRVVRGGESVERVLHISQILPLFHFHETLAEAVDELRHFELSEEVEAADDE